MSIGPIKLNVFQRLTRQWDAMHPYNGAQLMRLPGLPDIDRLSRTLSSTLTDLGIGEFEVRGRDFFVHRTPRISSDAFGVRTALAAAITAEINLPFALDRAIPVRPLIVSDGDGYYAGLVYHHWAADSFSIRLLLHQWLLRLLELPGQKAHLRIAREGFWTLFGPDRAGWHTVETFLTSAKWNARFKKVRRVDRESSEDLSTHFSLHWAEDGLIDRLVAAARRSRVKVNDLFLAAMARVCDAVPTLRRTPWRQDLALGTIVDLRPYAPTHWPASFGLYLGFTSLFVRPQEIADTPRLLRAIRGQHDLQQTQAAAQSSMLRMTAGLVLPRLLSPKGLSEFYRKRLALSAGISNVNLNPLWPAQFYPNELKAYVRVSPVGPMMPIVFTPTTLGNSLNLGLTCRRSVVSAEDAPKLAQNFFAQLRSFCETPQTR